MSFLRVFLVFCLIGFGADVGAADVSGLLEALISIAAQNSADIDSWSRALSVALSKIEQEVKVLGSPSAAGVVALQTLIDQLHPLLVGLVKNLYSIGSEAGSMSFHLGQIGSALGRISKDDVQSVLSSLVSVTESLRSLEGFVSSVDLAGAVEVVREISTSLRGLVGAVAEPTRILRDISVFFESLRRHPLTVVVQPSRGFFDSFSFKPLIDSARRLFSPLYVDLTPRAWVNISDLFSPLIVRVISDPVQNEPLDTSFCVVVGGRERCYSHQTSHHRHKRQWYNPLSWFSSAASSVLSASAKVLEFVIEPFFEAMVRAVRPLLSEVIKMGLNQFVFVCSTLIDIVEGVLKEVEVYVDRVVLMIVQLSSFLGSILLNLIMKILNILPTWVFSVLFSFLIIYMYSQKFIFSVFCSIPVVVFELFY